MNEAHRKTAEYDVELYFKACLDFLQKTNHFYQGEHMTSIAISRKRPASSSALRPVALLVTAVLTCLSAQTYAEDYAGSSRSSESVKARPTAVDLEKTFWACDYAASTRGVSGGESAICGENYEDFKRIKFGGDFQAFLKWWQQNKVAEHQALAAVTRTVAVPKANQVTSR
jgi:hypothetical protein